MTRIAHITIAATIDDDTVTRDDILRDLANELGSSIYLDDNRLTTVTFGINWTPPVRLTWRGSHASAGILADLVNRADDVPTRAGGEYAKADAEIETVTYGYDVNDPIRRDTSSLCTVDAYDGRHVLHDGDTLVSTATGWTVERAEQ
jgi:hypothetical protein